MEIQSNSYLFCEKLPIKNNFLNNNKNCFSEEIIVKKEHFIGDK